MQIAPQRYQSRASGCHDPRGRGPWGEDSTIRPALQVGSSVSGRRPASSCPGRPVARFSAKAAAAFVARRACRRASAVAAWSRGRHKRAASRHRPTCRAACQSGDACGSSRWAFPARITQTDRLNGLGAAARRGQRKSRRRPFRLTIRQAGQAGIFDAGASAVVPNHAPPPLPRNAGFRVANKPPHSQGDETAVFHRATAPTRRLSGIRAVTR